MTLRDLLVDALVDVEFEVLNGSLDCDVADLQFDSRDSGPGTLFFALPGLHTDGTHYLADAYRRGAVAALVQVAVQVPVVAQGLTVVQVADVRWAMSRLSARFFAHPSRELCVIGVTGTDGKSSTVSFISQLLELGGQPSGFFSTVSYKDGPDTKPNSFRQSTPEAPQIHGLLRTMKTNGVRYAVLESTSHGLSLKTARLEDVVYSCAVFTNVTQEHLEFHGSVERYRADKARLFEALDRGPESAFGVVNADDPHAQLYITATTRPVKTYTLTGKPADLMATDIVETTEGLAFTVVPGGHRVRLGLAGRFNVANVLAAALAVSGTTGVPLEKIWPLADRLEPVKGRMLRVEAGQPFEVLVDYAHTSGAFESLLPTVRARTKGRVIAVFGSGGERDRVKRPVQGRLADKYCDLIVLTDEDPRLEDPELILDEIQAGIASKNLGESLFRVRPRREALRLALELARADDTVLLLGKGHEASIIGTVKEPWDEEAEARAALRGLGFGGA